RDARRACVAFHLYNDERVSSKTVHIRLTEYSVLWSSTNLEADHQRVWLAKYFAALRKISRCSRSFAFSFSNARIRSASEAASACLGFSLDHASPFTSAEFFLPLM